jgi:hypothetical protein
VDICNSLANVNLELQNRGFDTSIYPSPVPIKTWSELDIFRSAKLIEPVAKLVHQLHEDGYTIIYLTARPRELEKVTIEWLTTYGLPEAPLHFTMVGETCTKSR